jgi:hypothetical protein
VHPWITRSRRVLGLGASLVVALLALSACGPPTYRFETSSTNEVVLKMPKSWNLVRSGTPASDDGSAAPTGSYLAVYDSHSRPSIDNVRSHHTNQPVAILLTMAVTKDQGTATTDDELRDQVWPVSEGSRATAKLSGFTGTDFKLMLDQHVDSRTAHGVHVVYTYDLGEGGEVYDQVAVTDARKTRIHLFVVHCSTECYAANRQTIASTMQSFTVKIH